MAVCSGIQRRPIQKPLEWSEVRLNKQSPEITLLHTKGRVIRKNPSYAKLCHPTEGSERSIRVIPKDGFRRKYNKVRKEAGVKWKEDICRHSWVTYLFAKDEDLTRKTIAGNGRQFSEYFR